MHELQKIEQIPAFLEPVKDKFNALVDAVNELSKLSGDGGRTITIENGVIRCTLQPGGGFGGYAEDAAEYNGYFKVVDVSTKDPITKFNIPKIAVIDGNNPTSQYCGYVHCPRQLHVYKVNSLVCAKKIKPLTDPLTYETYKTGYVIYAIDFTFGYTSFIEYFEDHESIDWSMQAWNAGSIWQLPLAKVIIKESVTLDEEDNEISEFFIENIIQLHYGYIFASIPTVTYNGPFKLIDVLPDDYNPALWEAPKIGEERTLKVMWGQYPTTTRAGSIFVGTQEILCECKEFTYEESTSTTTVYVRIWFEHGTYKYEFGTTTGAHIPSVTGEVYKEIGRAPSLRSCVQTWIGGDIDLTVTYWV